MQIETQYLSPTLAVLTPCGRMDADTSPSARQAIHNLAERGITLVVVDLEKVDFMDSSGLSALVSGMKALRKVNGNLGICRANAQIRTALRLTMLDRVLPVHESVEKTIQSLE